MKQINSEHMAGIVCRTLNRVDERLVDHGIRVAYIVLNMLETDSSLDNKKIRDLCFLTMIHDIGAYKTEEIDKMLQFETGNVWNHSIYGYLFTKYLSPFSDLSSVILFHHTDYDLLMKMPDVQGEIITWAQMIHLADRVDVCIQNKEQFDILSFLSRSRGTKFSSEMIDLFQKTEEKNSILEHLRKKEAQNIIANEVFAALKKPAYSEQEINTYLKMIIYAIDFRSPYTVMHTITTTGISQELSRLMGMNEEQQAYIYYGALLHDLGKIGIPVGILEYPGKLSSKDMNIMRTHVDVTAEIMNGEMEPEITEIALRHHEKLDGSGYPQGLTGDMLTPSERIVATADIVSALNGRRSYKEAFDQDRVVHILLKMKADGYLCKKTVDVMVEHFDEIMEQVKQTCSPILEVYEHINKEYEELCLHYAGAGQ